MTRPGPQTGLTFWADNQPGFRFAEHPVGTPEFFEEVESHRYRLEPHIPEIVRFDRWAGQDVLEIGCGIGTDAARFARAGARYVGVDLSAGAVELARERFALNGLRGEFEQACSNSLPFSDQSFDLVFSHGVLHHLEHTDRAVEEIHRVLRPGGLALVMLYHRDSLNYRLNIMTIRRLLAITLLFPGVRSLVGRLTGEDPAVLDGHVGLLREHGLGYLADSQLFLSNNTDGPGNPLSKVYSRADANGLFGSFRTVDLAIRYLNLRLIPGGGRLAASRLGRSMERRLGWHLYVAAVR